MSQKETSHQEKDILFYKKYERYADSNTANIHHQSTTVLKWQMMHKLFHLNKHS